MALEKLPDRRFAFWPATSVSVDMTSASPHAVQIASIQPSIAETAPISGGAFFFSFCANLVVNGNTIGAIDICPLREKKNCRAIGARISFNSEAAKRSQCSRTSGDSPWKRTPETQAKQ